LDGTEGGATTIASRINSKGYLTPSLPKDCPLITYRVIGRTMSARTHRLVNGIRIDAKGVDGWTQTTFSRYGYFTFSRVPPGKTTLKFSNNNYFPADRTIAVDEDVGALTGIADGDMIPKLRRGQWRAVLKWGAKPKDLDVHAMWGLTNVCSETPKAVYLGLRALLAKDATDGNGPETLYMDNVGRCQGKGSICDIRLLVSDTTTKSLPSSAAMIVLERGPTDKYVFKIGDCPKVVSKDGAWWHAATIDGKTNKLKWDCTLGVPAPRTWADEQKEKRAKKIKQQRYQNITKDTDGNFTESKKKANKKTNDDNEDDEPEFMLMNKKKVDVAAASIAVQEQRLRKQFSLYPQSKQDLGMDAKPRTSTPKDVSTLKQRVLGHANVSDVNPASNSKNSTKTEEDEVEDALEATLARANLPHSPHTPHYKTSDFIQSSSTGNTSLPRGSFTSAAIKPHQQSVPLVASDAESEQQKKQAAAHQSKAPKTWFGSLLSWFGGGSGTSLLQEKELSAHMPVQSASVGRLRRAST